jgi:hypothetical protein
VYQNYLGLDQRHQQSHCDYVGHALAMQPMHDPIGREGAKIWDLMYY